MLKEELLQHDDDKMNDMKSSKHSATDSSLLEVSSTTSSSSSTTSTIASSSPSLPLQSLSSVVEWLQSLELGYAADDDEDRNYIEQNRHHCINTKNGTFFHTLNPTVCFYCGMSPEHPTDPHDEEPSSSSQQQHQQHHTTEKFLFKCSQCRTISYCSKECQEKDWKQKQQPHKLSCASYQRVGIQMHISADQPSDQASAREELLQRVRFYAFPYAVHKYQTVGRGFLLLQSTQNLAIMSLTFPPALQYHNPATAVTVRKPGREFMKRSIMVHYLTLSEYDHEVCREDHEMAAFRSSLVQAIQSYDPEQQVVVLMRFRCGHVAAGIVPLVPEYTLSKQLGAMYYSHVIAGSIELQLDEL